MLWVDTALYGLLALYLDAVVPQETGTHRPPHFLCMPRFWGAKLGRRRTAPAPGADMHGLAHGLLSTQRAAGPGADPLECAREAAAPAGDALLVLDRLTKRFSKNAFGESEADVTAGLDEGLRSLNVSNLLSMANPHSYKKFQ